MHVVLYETYSHLLGVDFLCSYLNPSDYDLPNQFSLIRVNYFLFINKNMSYFSILRATKGLLSIFSVSLLQCFFPSAVEGKSTGCIVSSLDWIMGRASNSVVGLAGIANPSWECFSGWLTAVGLCTSDLPQITLELCQLDPIRPWCSLVPSLSLSLISIPS